MGRLLEESVASVVEGEQRVAVAFSGGLDSSVLALCASRRTEVVACTAYAKGAGDSTKARRAAELLGIPIATAEVDPGSIREALGSLDVPFVPTLMDRSLWCLYSVTSRVAKESGARVMLLGQLADELFGGYAKYLETLRREGPVAARAMMADDAKEYSLRGRVRDVAACGRTVEARFPFESEALVSFASTLPLSFKLRDGVRKAVLRRAAVNLGLPEVLAGAPKKAAQYSSGVQKLLAGSHF